MIMLNNKETTPNNMENKPDTKDRKKETMEDMFRKEIDAYCAYKEWLDETDDEILEMALEEIMVDEYLHAKFLRDYMIDKDKYTLTDSDPHEKKFWMIQKKMWSI